MGGSEKRLPRRSPGSSKIESLSRSARMASIADPGVNEWLDAKQMDQI